MKKIRLAFVSMAVFGALMLSCDGDVDKSNIAATIEGRWTPTKTITITNGNQDVYNYTGNEAECDKDYREFASGGAYRYVVWYLNATDDCTEDIITSTWSKSGDMITIVDTNPSSEIESPPDAGVYEITKLTGSELRLKSSATVGSTEVEVTEVFKRL